ncbi:MAG: hypothetical protein JO039_12200 [Solirubrobacterales bacterium]|nr:hypothetical protein [Solirubrobacterales bacterium]
MLDLLSRVARAVVFSAAITLIVATGAGAAVILGSTVRPAGSRFPGPCGGFIHAQLTSDRATPYGVPRGGAGYLTQWSTNTTLAIPGSPVTFVVLAHTRTPGDYLVAGFDPERLPNPLPASGLVTFKLADQILIGPGDLIGLWSPADANGANCEFHGGTTPAAATIALVGKPPGAFIVGEKVSVASTSSPGWRVPVAALLIQYQDSAVKAVRLRSRATAGRRASLGFAVINHGPSTLPIRFADTLPHDLKIDAAAATHGTCAVTGQRVTCVIERLPRGSRSFVHIVLTPRRAGRYSDIASVANVRGVRDPNRANNRSSTHLTVAPPSRWRLLR